jgi:23S rRNA pseudouridine1911/1915/1917 synthase
VNGLIARGLIPEVALDLDAPDDPVAHERPGIVHRLDKGTSGVMIVARSVVARERLKALFASHDLDREYSALTIGMTSEATLRSLHGRHPTDRLRFTTRVSQGKHAITHVSVIEALHGATLVRCRLETGRTHQIRVHLTELARTPILGDPLYGKPPIEPALRTLHDTLGHQALHAGLLALVHPITGKKMRWTTPLPTDFAAAYTALQRV